MKSQDGKINTGNCPVLILRYNYTCDLGTIHSEFIMNKIRLSGRDTLTNIARYFDSIEIATTFISGMGFGLYGS